MDGDCATAGEGSLQEPYCNEFRSEESPTESSRAPSWEIPAGLDTSEYRERNKLRFDSGSEVNAEADKQTCFCRRDKASSEPTSQTLRQSTASPQPSRSRSLSNLARCDIQNQSDHLVAGPADTTTLRSKSRPRQTFLRSSSATALTETLRDTGQDGLGNIKNSRCAPVAQIQGKRRVALIGSGRGPIPPGNSPDEFELNNGRPFPVGNCSSQAGADSIPLMSFRVRGFDGPDSESDDDHQPNKTAQNRPSGDLEAHRIVWTHTRNGSSTDRRIPNSHASGVVSRHITPTLEQDSEDYIAQPHHYRDGVLFTLLRLYNTPGHNSRGGGREPATSPGPSETSTPGNSGPITVISKPPKWYRQYRRSRDALSGLDEASEIPSPPGRETPRNRRGSVASGSGVRSGGSQRVDSDVDERAGSRLEDEIRITVHIAEVISRQNYLLKLCKALIIYGAPTHRLEEYMKMSARALEIEGQFLFIPGCMLISFDDSSTHTTEVRLVRTAQGLDLGNLMDVHEIYKQVVHDVIGVEEATTGLEAIFLRPLKYNRWWLLVIYGLACAAVGPFGFDAALIDIPPLFVLGVVLGISQLFLAPKSDLYNSLFEVTTSIVGSFLSKAFGSIQYRGAPLFCFSALAQSSIALILPGYLVLCASLELQSKALIAGSIRLIYASVYSMFLVYGITIGAALFDLVYSNPSTPDMCAPSMSEQHRWLFVPLFTLCLCMISQAKWKQMPAMLFIAVVGYIVSVYSAKGLPENPQIVSTFGALAIGVLANLYARIRHGVAAAAMLPAVFVLVPAGLTATSSVVMGVYAADEAMAPPMSVNGTAILMGGTLNASFSSVFQIDMLGLYIAYRLILLSIAMTVGFFLSDILVYPFGKRRSGLFSF